MTTQLTSRGFPYIEFEDTYKQKCSLVVSSAALEQCVWLGVDNNQMHINRKLAGQLAEVLQKFSQTGEI